MKMKSIRLGDLGEIISGATPRTDVSDFWNGNIPWITPADLSHHSGIYFQGNPKRITKKGFESCSTTMVPSGSILYSSRAPIGHCAVAKYPICTNQGFKNIVPNEKLNPVYGFFVLKFLTPTIKAKGHGATFAEVTKETMEEIEIPYCELLDQNNIAAQLTKADRLCHIRRYALEMSGSLFSSVFIEMFGDPEKNSKGWDKCIIDDVIDFSQYGTSQKNNAEKQGYPVLGMGNLTYSGELNLTELPHVDLPQDEYEQLRLQPGDIIFNRTNSTDLVGKTACWRLNIDAVVASYLIRIRLKPIMLPEFFTALLNTTYFKKIFRERCKKAVGQSNISPTLLKEFPIYIPPVEDQEKFVNFVARYERLRSIQRESLRQAEHLFQSLLHQAFSER